MNTKPLCAVLRSLAKSITDQEIEVTGQLSSLTRDAAEMANVVARLLEGKSVYEAFGAPGDWGYGTAVGDALRDLYNSDWQPVQQARIVAITDRGAPSPRIPEETEI